MRCSGVRMLAILVLAIWSPTAASAQKEQPKPPVDQVCCYTEKPRCESTCPIMSPDQREVCLRECEGRLRGCLAQGVFVPPHGKDIMCFKVPTAPGR
jgi:hypothetical protein